MSKVAHLLRRHKHLWIVSMCLCAVLATLIIHPDAALAGGLHWHHDQDNCAALTPHGALYNNRGGLFVAPYGQMTGEFTWDGAHKLVACDNNNPSNPGPQGDNRAFYADGREARSGAAYLSGGYGAAFQCEELVQRYAYARWGDAPAVWGHNAAATWDHHPSHFIAIPNGSVIPPVPGDILVWRSDHMAIVTSVSPQGVIIFQQNGYDPDLHPAMDGATARIGYSITRGQYQIGTADLDGWLHSPDNSGAHVTVLATNTGVGGGKGVVPPVSGPPTSSSVLPTHGASATWAATTLYAQPGNKAKHAAVTLSFTRDATGNLWETPVVASASATEPPTQLPVPAAPVPLASDPVATQDGNGVLWIYATGSDGLIYALPQDGALQRDGAPLFTGAWQTLPAGPTGVAFAGQPAISSLPPASAQDHDGAKAILVARDQQGALWYLTQSHKSGTAKLWQELTLPKGGRQLFASDPVINLGPTGAFQVIARDAQGRLWLDAQTIDQRHAAWPVLWTGWQALPAGPVPFIGAPALGVTLPFVAPNTPHAAIAARGTDGLLYTLDMPLSKTPKWTKLPALAAQIAADPAIITNARGALEIVVGGADGSLWQAAEISAGRWSAWALIAASNAPTSPLMTAVRPAVIWNGSGLTILAHSTDGAIWQIAMDKRGAWQGWATVATLPTLDPGNDPAAAAGTPSSWVAAVMTTSGASETFAFARTASGQVQFTVHTEAGNGSVTGALPGATTFSGDPAAVVDASGALTVYATGVDGSLWTNTLIAPETPADANAWSGWTSIGQPLGASLAGTPRAIDLPASANDTTVAWGVQRLIAARDSQQHVWIWHQSMDGSSQFWQELTKPDGSALAAASDPVIVLNLNQAAQVAVTDPQGVIWQTWQTGAGADGQLRWSGWQPALQGPVAFTGMPALGSEFVAPMRAALVAQGADGALYALGQSDLDGWQPAPMPLPPPATGVTIVGAPLVAVNTNNTLDIFALGSDGGVWRLSQTATYSPTNMPAWQTWQRLSLDQTAFTGRLGVTANGVGQTAVIAQDAQGHIWEYAITPGAITGTWVAWDSAGS